VVEAPGYRPGKFVPILYNQSFASLPAADHFQLNQQYTINLSIPSHWTATPAVQAKSIKSFPLNTTDVLGRYNQTFRVLYGEETERDSNSADSSVNITTYRQKAVIVYFVDLLEINVYLCWATWTSVNSNRVYEPSYTSQEGIMLSLDGSGSVSGMEGSSIISNMQGDRSGMTCYVDGEQVTLW
jgi:hypothetical protein